MLISWYVLGGQYLSQDVSRHAQGRRVLPLHPQVGTTHADNPQAGGSKTADGRHSSTLAEDIHATFRKVKWVGLKLLGSEAGAGDDEAFVRFRASFRVVNQLQHAQKQKGIALQHLTEKARFLRHDGVWQYVDGDVKYTADSC